MDLGVSGLASGFAWRSLISQLLDVERAPEQQMRSEQSVIQQRNIAYGAIQTQLSVLSDRVAALKDPALYDGRVAVSSDLSVASAVAQPGAAPGSHSFTVSQLATAAMQKGTSDVGQALA